MVRIDEDGYLLQQSFHKSCIKKQIDFSKYDWLYDDRERYDRYRYFEKLKQEKKWQTLSKKQEECAVAYLFGISGVKDGDLLYEYDDIGVLTGSAGYVLIRNGFVYGTYATRRS